MKKLSQLITMPFLSMIFITISACSQSKLPATWQPGMKLSMSYSGGMRYYSYKLEITDTLSYFIENNEGVNTYYKLQLTRKDLDSLLQFMRQKHFDRIEEEMTGPVHDKGTETLMLSWYNNVIGVSEGYAQRVKDKFRDDYNAIEHYIIALRERTKQKVKSIPGINEV